MSDPLPSATASAAVSEILGEVTSPVEYATVAATAAVLLLGAYVGYQAYRGYRRNDNRPVLLLGVGIFLATTVRQLASVLAYLVVPENAVLLLVVFFGVSIAGLASVLYAFVWA